MAKKILLSNEFGNNIFTRNTISSFFERLNDSKEKEIVLDFSGIDFISRSCADEYLKRKQCFEKKIIEEHMSSEVSSMFRVVKAQYARAGFSIQVESCSKNNILLA